MVPKSLFYLLRSFSKRLVGVWKGSETPDLGGSGVIVLREGGVNLGIVAVSVCLLEYGRQAF